MTVVRNAVREQETHERLCRFRSHNRSQNIRAKKSERFELKSLSA